MRPLGDLSGERRCRQILAAPTSAQDRSTARFEALVALAEAKMVEHRVPGMAIGIIDNGVLRTRGLGVTNVEDPRPASSLMP